MRSISATWPQNLFQSQAATPASSFNISHERHRGVGMEVSHPYFGTMQSVIGKNLSSLPDFSRTITAKEGFKAQLEAPYLPIPLGMSTLRMTSQIRDR